MGLESTDFTTAVESNSDIATPEDEASEEAANEVITTTAPSADDIDEVLNRLRNEPARASNYGKTAIYNSLPLNDARPKRTIKAPSRFGCGLSHPARVG